MGIENKAKEVVEKKQATEAEIQVALQAETEASESAKEQQFQKTYQERAALDVVLENYHNTAKGVEEAKGNRTSAAKKINEALDVVNVDSENETTFTEVLKEASDDDKEGDTVEAGYFGASEALKEARQVALGARENLRALGIDLEGKDEAELAQEVLKVATEKQQELEKFVREHPDSELPEAQELHRELLEAIGKKMFDRGSSISYRTEALGKAVGQNFDIGERDWESLQNNYDEEGRKKYFNNRMSSSLKDFFKDEKNQNFYAEELASLSPEDQALGQQAVTELLAAQIAGAEIFGISTDIYGENNPKKTRAQAMLLGKARFRDVDPGLKYEDSSGFNEEGEQAIFNAIDRAPFREIVQKLGEMGELGKKIDNWEHDKRVISGEITDLEDEEKVLSRENETKARNLEQLEGHVSKLKSSIETLQKLGPELTIVASDIPENEEVILDNRYGEFYVDFSKDEKERDEIDMQIKENFMKGEQAIKEAESALSQARNQKPGFLGSGKAKIAQDITEATTALTEAKSGLERVKTENMKKFNEIRDRQSAQRASVVKKLTDTHNSVRIGEFKGTWKELLGTVQGRIAWSIEQTQTEMSQGEIGLEKFREEKRQQDERLSQIQERRNVLKTELDTNWTDSKFGQYKQRLELLRRTDER